jgi:hypothetical protein
MMNEMLMLFGFVVFCARKVLTSESDFLIPCSVCIKLEEKFGMIVFHSFFFCISCIKKKKKKVGIFHFPHVREKTLGFLFLFYEF